MSKIDQIESEENPNYEADKAKQKELKDDFDSEQKVRDIKAAIKLLQDNGFLVTIE